ncbi:hypothetical protein [Fructilactobacillus frigidiflavus]|uniref:hypothetical protein n=1 Tax=Fructilactobacillus frigidiflavus TaxID=3242688 RepID=UPI003756EC44
MTIKVFLSKSNNVNPEYKYPIKLFQDFLLNEKDIETITLGGNYNTNEIPIKSIKNKMKECYGAIILGTPQIKKDNGEYMSTPWNQIEGALAYDNDLPILIISTTNPEINEGLFFTGTLPVHYNAVNLKSSNWFSEQNFASILNDWIRTVREKFYKK